MTIGDEDRRKLVALLDVLLPGLDGFPSATAAGVGDRLLSKEGSTDPVRSVLIRLDAGFAEAPAQVQISGVRDLEAREADLFQALIATVYAAYYTSPAVLAVISARTGYQHPPQPAGYALSAFDEAILAKVRLAPPSWRDVPFQTTEGQKS